jgi:hypothetical protein
MSDGQRTDVKTIAPSRITIAPGSTLAFFVDTQAGMNNLLFKYYSGGTLEILGATGMQGSTLTAGQLASANQTGYLVGTSEVLSIKGDTRFYLSATGATTIVHVLKGRSGGTDT